MRHQYEPEAACDPGMQRAGRQTQTFSPATAVYKTAEQSHRGAEQTWMLNSATEPVLPVPKQPPIKTISSLGVISGNNVTSRAAFVSAPVQTSTIGSDLRI